MDHVAYHHENGHTLSYARPDFQLFNSLWETHLIDGVMYRELKRNTPDKRRLIRRNPSPSASEIGGSPPSAPKAEGSEKLAVVNERARDRRRRMIRKIISPSIARSDLGQFPHPAVLDC